MLSTILRQMSSVRHVGALRSIKRRAFSTTSQQQQQQLRSLNPWLKTFSGAAAIAGAVAVFACVSSSSPLSKVSGTDPKQSAALDEATIERKKKRQHANFVADAVEIAQPSLAHITNIRQTIFGEFGTGGSGFVMSNEGFVATNAHVVMFGKLAGSGKLKVTLFDGTEYEGEVWAVDTATDLALIKLDLKTSALSAALVPAAVGKSCEMRSGEWVVALGSPLNLQNSVTVGVVSSVARHATELGMPDRPFEFIQTDASINSGNSGGPLINLDGQVVGINTMKAAGGPEGISGISFAIPIDVAWPVLQQLKEYQRVRRPFLGLRMVTIDAHVTKMEKGRNFPQDQMDGVLVLQVAPGSPAERGGVQAGDIIIKMNGKFIKESTDVVKVLGFEVGKKIEIEVRRGKDTRKTLYVITEALPTVEF
jgi:S1-C subfamily serine protease